MSSAPPAVVMGCSAGGMGALRTVLGGLSSNFPRAVVVVCHTGSEDVTTFCELLELASALPVREARERQSMAPGVVHMAPSGYHLLLERGGRFSLSVDERVSFARPAIDVLFETAASACGKDLIGVVMTGANNDGAAGLRAIRRRGGVAIVQDPLDAQASAMPQAAIETAGADHVVPLEGIAPLLNRLCP
ncbi:chemotaxis protein CheB [Dokdonella ginsengisoli]|uniref:protein-glutamate methylesterase n=1 Tax=Dokdonella ginsengisoli TaxID=363846 RepID=A0ABV9QY39_9GAMM